MAGQMQRMKVQFTHPRDCRYFDAEVDPDCTGKQALEGLLVGDGQGPFLEPPPAGRPYSLVVQRNSRQITAHLMFRDAGVQSGDIIEVLQDARGA